jgi:hypothetical protein
MTTLHIPSGMLCGSASIGWCRTQNLFLHPFLVLADGVYTTCIFFPFFSVLRRAPHFLIRSKMMQLSHNGTAFLIFLALDLMMAGRDQSAVDQPNKAG